MSPQWRLPNSLSLCEQGHGEYIYKNSVGNLGSSQTVVRNTLQTLSHCVEVRTHPNIS